MSVLLMVLGAPFLYIHSVFYITIIVYCIICTRNMRPK